MSNSLGAFSKLSTCACGRSPIGKCVGWHNLSQEDYLNELRIMTGQMKEFYEKQRKESENETV